MKRIQFIELEDLNWMPNAIRNGGTDVLDFFFAKMDYYNDISPILSKTLAAVRSPRVVDPCSGAGGGTLQVLEDCEQKTQKQAGIYSAFAATGAGSWL
jgi:hypothetical protein